MSAPGFAPLTPASLPYGAAALRLDVPAALSTEPGDALRQPVDPHTFVNEFTRPLPSYQETFSGPGYESRPLPTSGVAVAALVCGIVGVFTLAPAVAAIALGHVGLWQTARNTHLGRGLAIGGLVLGYATAVVVGLVMLGVWIAGP